MKSLRTAVFLGASALILVLSAGCDAGSTSTDPEAPENWARWRGPQAMGVTPLGELPLDWGPESDNVKWKASLSAGGASQPIAVGGRVYLTGSRGGKGRTERTVAALDIEDGSLLWETVISQRKGEKTHHQFGSHAIPTPVTDGETVWAYFGGYLAALSAEGELLWRVTVDEGYWGGSRYGAASSPILVGDSVVVFSDDEWGEEKRNLLSWMAAYDRGTGEELWRTEWDDTCCSYSTPVLRGSGSDLEIVVSTTPFLLGFDAKTGERLWQFDLPVRQVVPSLVTSGDVWIQAGAVHSKKIVAYRLTGFGRETRGEKLWTEVRAAPEMASPVIYDDLLFTVARGGVMSALEPETGELVWRKRLPKGDYRSSMIAGDGKVYVTTLGGKTYVVEAGRKFNLLATNDLAEYSQSSLAVAGDCMLVRVAEHLYCVERGPSAAAS